METTTLEPVTYKRSEWIKQLTENCEQIVPLITELISELNNTGFEFSKKDVFDMIQSKNATTTIKNIVISQKTTDQNPEILGIKISKEKLFDLIEIDNLSNVISKLNEIDTRLFISVRKYISIDENLEVSYSGTSIESDYTTTITDQEKLRKYYILNRTANALNEYYELIGVECDEFKRLKNESTRQHPQFVVDFNSL